VDPAGEFDRAADALRTAIAGACTQTQRWPGKVAASVQAALGFAARDPAAARRIALESLAQGGEVLQRRRRLFAAMALALAAGRLECPRARRLPANTESLLIGAIASLVGQRLLGGEDEALVDLAPQVIELTLLPYLGPEQARAWAQRPEAWS